MIFGAETLRRWVRYPVCGLCDAQAGHPCTRHPAPRYGSPTPNQTPHPGRRRGTTRCGLWGRFGRQPCAKVKDHGGTYHCDEFGRQWRIDRTDEPPIY